MNISHSFSVKVAIAVGERKAVILTNFAYWHLKNGADGINIHDGYVWTYNSIAGFAKVWPYLTEKEVRRALESLEKDGYVKTGNYNEWKIDRTKWYALTPKACDLLEIEFALTPHLPKRANANSQTGKCNLPNGQTDLTERANGSAQTGEPLPLEKPIENSLENSSTAPESADGDFENLSVDAEQSPLINPVARPPSSLPTYGDGRLHKLVRDFYKANPDLYPVEMYTQFLKHWTLPILNSDRPQDIGKEKWATGKTFDVDKKLDTWYTGYLEDLKKQHGPAPSTRQNESANNGLGVVSRPRTSAGGGGKAAKRSPIVTADILSRDGEGRRNRNPNGEQSGLIIDVDRGNYSVEDTVPKAS